MSWSVCVVCLVIDLNFKVCGMVQSLVLNCLVLSSLCVSCLCFVDVLLYCCFKKSLCADKPPKGHNLTLPTFIPIYQKSLTTPEQRCCFIKYECLVFASPLVVLHVNPLFAFFNVSLCLCRLCLVCFVWRWIEALPNCAKSNLCFAFWKLFWCSSQVLPCFNVPALMHMLPFVFPYILPCPVAFLVLCICSAS